MKVHVVHLAAECWPFAFSGGLGMAVSGLARSQAASGLTTTAIIPFHRSVRAAAVDLNALTPLSLTVDIGMRTEVATVWRARSSPGEPRMVFVEHDGFFDRAGIYGSDGRDFEDNAQRYAFFTMAALQALPRLVRSSALLHAHDWHTALAPALVRRVFGGHPYFDAVPTVVSVHNAAYQGRFPRSPHLELGRGASVAIFGPEGNRDSVNWLGAGLAAADLVVAVSPTYARELTSTLGGFGMDRSFHDLGARLVGIRNGIEPEVWDPQSDPMIHARYSGQNLRGKAACKAALQARYGLAQGPTTPLMGMCARLVEQKGLDLVLGLLRSTDPGQFVFLGQGERRFEQALLKLAAERPGRIAVHLGFNDRLEHELLAGLDILLMPSLYEPCGLTQMRAQRYGTIPLGRRVGGLADTIEDGVTGFLFDEYGVDALHGALQRALARFTSPGAWVSHQRAAMQRSFDWGGPAGQYLDIYRWAQQLRAAPVRACDGPRLASPRFRARSVRAPAAPADLVADRSGPVLPDWSQPAASRPTPLGGIPDRPPRPKDPALSPTPEHARGLS